MLPLFTPILLLQGFCLYHAYQSKVEQKWFFIIGFIPLIGCLIYLYNHFYSRRNITDLKEGMKEVVNTNYEIVKLENDLAFANSITNNTRLADKYLEMGRFKDAAKHYEICVNRFDDDDDDHILMKLVETHYSDKNYTEAVKFGERISQYTDFEDAEERICLAWSYFHTGNSAKADEHFKAMDSTLTNYIHRIQYSYYLDKTNRKKEALQKLNLMSEEYNQMNPHEKSQKRHINKMINEANIAILDNP
ncbi:MAG: hypothetical protein ACI81Y_000299 [Glaciecola sp.]|jgi:hypothetical protein